MIRLSIAVGAVAALAAGGASASSELHGPRTIATTAAPITRFAQNYGWAAWTTDKSCADRLYLRSLRTGRQVSAPLRSEASCSSSTFDALAVAGGRAIWTTLVGAGNTEFDFGVGTMTAGDPHPRRVREMAMIRPEFGPDPLPPPLAARGRLFVYYRHEDGILAQPAHELEQVEGNRPRRLFAIDDPVAVAVDRTRIATMQATAQGATHYAVWTPDGGELSDSEVAGLPLAIALDGHYLAILTRAADTGEKAIVIIRAGWGVTLRTVPVPAATSAFLSASGGRAVYAVGPTIYTLTLGSGSTSAITSATGRIAGLAITGANVYWAEDGRTRGRVRTVQLAP